MPPPSLEIIKMFSKSILSSCEKDKLSCCTIEYIDGKATIRGWPTDKAHMIGLQEFPRKTINEKVGMALRNQAVAVFLTVMEDGVLIDKCSAVIKSEYTNRMPIVNYSVRSDKSLNSLKVRHLTVTDPDIAEFNSTVVQMLDTTTQIDTLQKAIDALVANPAIADVGVVMIAPGQTVTVDSDVFLATAQNKFREIQIMGSSTEIIRDTVASVAVGGPGSTTFGGLKVWLLPSLTNNTPVVGALDNVIVLNETTGYYFVVKSTDGTAEVTVCALKSQSGIASYGYDGREPFVVGDVLVFLQLTSTLLVSENVDFQMIENHATHILETIIEVSDGASINSSVGGVLHFRGCELYTRNTQPVGMITFPFYASGCYVHVDNEDNILFSSIEFTESADGRRVFRNCLFEGGGITATVGQVGCARQEYYGCWMDLKTIGINITGLFFFYLVGCWGITADNTRNVFSFGTASSKNSVASFKACTFEYTGVPDNIFEVQGVSCSFVATEIIGYRINCSNAALEQLVSDFTGTSGAYVISLDTLSTFACYTPCDISNASGVGLNITNGSVATAPFGISGNCSTYGVYLSNGGRIVGSGFTITGGTADCRLGASGDKSWATIVAGVVAVDRNDYTLAGSENCSASVT